MKEVIDKLDKLDERLDSVDRTLVRQEAQLAEHIRRTELLEHNHARMEQDIIVELAPIKTHVAKVTLLGKLAMWLIPVLSAIIFGVLKYVNI